ncbi:MAG: glycogen/starch/alpha-glucan phosphorylase, partial [Pirellulaceae bacterium]
FTPIREMLLERGDFYMHLADLPAYVAMQEKVAAAFGDHELWTRKSIINVASSGKFSSDRTIAEYASSIWNTPACPIP